MKKILCFVLCISFVFLFSCAYKADYPQKYTAQYCFDNYFPASPHLRYLSCAKNMASRLHFSGEYMAFYGIEDIPFDKYLATTRGTLLFSPGPKLSIVQSKECRDCAIFDYTVSKAELFWRRDSSDIDWNESKNRCFWGDIIFYKSIVNIDPDYIQRYIGDAITEGAYICDDSFECTIVTKEIERKSDFFGIGTLPAESMSVLMRLYFSEYSNLVWDAYIFKHNNKYYLRYMEIFNDNTLEEINSSTKGLYNNVYIELPEDISSIIAGLDTE